MSWEAVAITAAIRGAKDFFSYAQKHPEVYVVGAVLGGAFFLVWWSERKKIISPSVSKKAPEHKDALTEILERTPERNKEFDWVRDLEEDACERDLTEDEKARLKAFYDARSKGT